MIELEVNGRKLFFDDVQARQQQDWLDKRENHVMWVMSGGLLGKRDESEPVQQWQRTN